MSTLDEGRAEFIRHTAKEAELALERAFQASPNLAEGGAAEVARPVTLGLIAVGRCVLAASAAVGLRLDRLIEERRNDNG